jgi:hypothetical protein
MDTVNLQAERLQTKRQRVATPRESHARRAAPARSNSDIPTATSPSTTSATHAARASNGRRT